MLQLGKQTYMHACTCGSGYIRGKVGGLKLHKGIKLSNHADAFSVLDLQMKQTILRFQALGLS